MQPLMIVIAMGIGITGTQGSIGGFPEAFVTFLGGSSVILATLVAFVLNLVLPGRENLKWNKLYLRLESSASN